MSILVPPQLRGGCEVQFSKMASIYFHNFSVALGLCCNTSGKISPPGEGGKRTLPVSAEECCATAADLLEGKT